MTLTYRDKGSSGTQLEVLSGTVVVARLWKAVLSRMADQDARWSWTWESGPTLEHRHGTADTIEEAKAILELQWLTWLKAAGLRERRSAAMKRSTAV